MCPRFPPWAPALWTERLPGHVSAGCGRAQGFFRRRDALTVPKLHAFEERIAVYVVGGELRTGHSFSLGGRRFLTLRYEISRPGRPDRCR
jgi:hypothetical protein